MVPGSPLATYNISDMGHVLRKDSELDLQSTSSLADDEDIDTLSDDGDGIRGSFRPRCNSFCQRFSILYIDTGIFFVKKRSFAPCWVIFLSFVLLIYLFFNAFLLFARVSDPPIIES